jgi:hypothetical protein
MAVEVHVKGWITSKQTTRLFILLLFYAALYGYLAQRHTQDSNLFLSTGAVVAISLLVLIGLSGNAVWLSPSGARIRRFWYSREIPWSRVNAAAWRGPFKNTLALLDLSSTLIERAKPVVDFYVYRTQHDEVDAFVRARIPILDESSGAGLKNGIV